MKPLFLLLLTTLITGRAELPLAEHGKAVSVILIDRAATPTERAAAKELANTLTQITGGTYAIRESSGTAPERAILVGAGMAARRAFPEIPFDELEGEELVIKTKGQRLLLSGGQPRGTFYAVSRFLQDECGVRWWTPWATRIPEQPTLRIGDLNQRVKPVFEYREPFWYPAFNADWAVRNFANGQSARIPEALGGCIKYKGFVHTFYPLVSPDTHFTQHPEWFSLLNGERTTKRAQLCLTNPDLRLFMVDRVKQWLRESPDARIVSVSQNDWHGACTCPDCKALDEAEGSHAGTLLSFVNYVAEHIETEFPHVAVDTLAYQYTRKPPKTIRPRPNVIVRLCSIECNFRQPLDHPSNAAFADDIRGWSKICQRLYIWDYTTDFAHYVQPHPNWFTLGQNVRFFAKNNVRGVFEQGAYQSHGSEMAEMRAWVLAQLLWNPESDDRALIQEFLENYYSPQAAAPILEYMSLMHAASKDHNLTCYSPTSAPFLRFKTLAAAERLWRNAEEAVNADPELLTRVKLAHLPLRYVWLSRWKELRKECQESGAEWPLSAEREEVAAEWKEVADGQEGKPWTKVTRLNEPGLTVDKFLDRVRVNSEKSQK